MFKRRFNKNAQSTLEYAILIGVIVAALIAMQVYLKRGYQGKLRDSADDMGEQFSPGKTRVYKHSKAYPSETYELTEPTGTTTIKYITGRKFSTESDSYERVSGLEQEKLFDNPSEEKGQN